MASTSTKTAVPKAPLLDKTGKASKQVSLDGVVFAAEVKPHLVHETVRAELNANRAGTRGAKSRLARPITALASWITPSRQRP